MCTYKISTAQEYGCTQTVFNASSYFNFYAIIRCKNQDDFISSWLIRMSSELKLSRWVRWETEEGEVSMGRLSGHVGRHVGWLCVPHGAWSPLLVACGVSQGARGRTEFIELWYPSLIFRCEAVEDLLFTPECWEGWRFLRTMSMRGPSPQVCIVPGDASISLLVCGAGVGTWGLALGKCNA